MIILRRGDRLPSVAVAQMLLVQYGDIDIKIDGHFGRHTREAVVDFQRKNGITPNGKVRAETWRALNKRNYKILDSVDATDPHILDHEDIVAAGGQPIVNYGMSGGSPVVLNRILASATMGRLCLLRFHGHGGPGDMIISSGAIDAGSSLSSSYGPKFYKFLEKLRPLFLPFGSVELNGCRVGLGRSGRSLLHGMANALGVPVTAGLQSQYGGGRDTFRFEGPTRTICPNGMSLKQWAKSNCRVSMP